MTLLWTLSRTVTVVRIENHVHVLRDQNERNKHDVYIDGCLKGMLVMQESNSRK